MQLDRLHYGNHRLLPSRKPHAVLITLYIFLLFVKQDELTFIFTSPGVTNMESELCTQMFFFITKLKIKKCK